MKFKKVAEYFQKLEETDSRLEMEDILIEVFNVVDREEVAIISYFLDSKLAPRFIESEFGLSEKSVVHVLKEMFPNFNVESKMVKAGDIGDVFLAIREENKSKIRGGVFDIVELYRYLWEIADHEGSGSYKAKKNDLKELLSECSGLEGKYISRLVAGDLRIGMGDRTILSALKKNLELETSGLLNYAYGVSSDLGYVAQIALDKGEDGLKNLEINLGIPLAAELVQRVETAEDILERYEKVLIQPKYDGLRCQIHVFEQDERSVEKHRVWSRFQQEEKETLFSSGEKKQVLIFSRNLDNITDMFPDIVKSIRESKLSDCILDGEIIGVGEDGNFLEFQRTIKRKRKYEVDDIKEDVPVKAFIFDCLYSKRKPLLNKPLHTRVGMLGGLLEGATLLEETRTDEVSEITKLQMLFEEYLNRGLEGVIAKDPDSIYKPGLRRYDWIKLKKSTNKNFRDTVDTVVLGYYSGTGKRAELGIGGILVGVLDKAGGNKLVALTKVGTGMTEDQLKKMKYKLDTLEFELPKDVNVKETEVGGESLKYFEVVRGGYKIEVPKDSKPDVWVEPKVVSVIEADEVSDSNSYNGGISLRFPRLEIFDRMDKDVRDITTLEELKSN